MTRVVQAARAVFVDSSRADEFYRYISAPESVIPEYARTVEVSGLRAAWAAGMRFRHLLLHLKELRCLDGETDDMSGLDGHPASRILSGMAARRFARTSNHGRDLCDLCLGRRRLHRRLHLL